jgi:hypothetical protein
MGFPLVTTKRTVFYAQRLMDKRSPRDMLDGLSAAEKIILPNYPPGGEPFGLPLTIDELEDGLRALDSGETDPLLFWQRNLGAYRKTLLVAISETLEALCASDLPTRWRAVLERDVEELRCYLLIADAFEDFLSSSAPRQ